MRPGYKPPNRNNLGTDILDAVYTDMEGECCTKLRGQEVSLCIDGWSNICNDPKVAASIQHENKVYIVGTTDTSGSSHNSEYLAKLRCTISKKRKISMESA